MEPDKSGRTPPPERGTVEVEIHPQPGVASEHEPPNA